MEGRGVTAVEFILLAGIAVFLVMAVSLFAVSNIFNPAANQSNQTSGGVLEARKCFQVDCSDACNPDDPSQLLQSGVCVGGKCVYRGGRVCGYGCDGGRCKGGAPLVEFTNNSCLGAPLYKGDYASTSSDPDGKITTYHWIFGDGATNTTSHPSVSHPYYAAGKYDVTLKVIDNDGMENSTTREILVC